MVEKSHIFGNVWSPIQAVNPIYAYVSQCGALSSKDERLQIFTWVVTSHQCNSFVCEIINQTRSYKGR